MEAQDNQRMFYGWINAAILFCVYLASTGLVVYGYSVIFPAMVEDFNWSRGTASIANSISFLALGFLTPLVAVVLRKFGSKKTIIFGLSVLVVGLILLGTAIRGIWLWTIVWGLIVPFGVAFAGAVPVHLNVMKWFNLRRATVLGLVMTAAPLGGFIVQPVYTWFMELTGTWRTGWLLSSVIVALVLILSYWLRDSPEDMGQCQDGIRPDEGGISGGSQKQQARTYRTPIQWKVGEAYKTWALRLFVVLFVAKIMALMLILSHGVLHLTDTGLTSMQAAYVLMAILIGSAVVRFPMGWVGDRIEPRWILTSALGFMVLSFFVIWRAPGFLVLMVCGPIFGAAYGTTLVMDTTLLGNYFSPESYPGIMAILFPIMTVAMSAIPILAGYTADKLGSYELVFMFCGAALAIGFILSIFLAPPSLTTES